MCLVTFEKWASLEEFVIYRITHQTNTDSGDGGNLMMGCSVCVVAHQMYCENGFVRQETSDTIDSVKSVR